MSLVGNGWPARCAAETTSPSERIVLGAILNNCQNSDDASRAIGDRLRQLGLTLETPSGGQADCIGLACATRLKGQPGYLLGGQVSAEQSTLWLIDLAKDQALIQRHVGHGVDTPHSLARQAAVLAERLYDQQAVWIPRAQAPTCDELPIKAEPPAEIAEFERAAPKDALIVMAVHAPRSMGKYVANVQKGVRRSLMSLGLQVREVRGTTPPQNPRDALPPNMQELPLLDVQLLVPEHEEKDFTPDGAVVRLSDGRRAIQASVDCAIQDCELGQMIQFIRRTSTSLLDSFNNHAGSAEASAAYDNRLLAQSCIPPTACTMFNSPTVRSSPSEEHPREVVAALAAPQPKPSPTSSLKPHFIGSGILSGISLLGFIPAGILLSKNGQPVEGSLCSVGQAMYPCHWNTTTAYAVSFTLAGVGLASGLIWLGATAAKARSQHD